MALEVANLDAGDIKYFKGETVTLDTDGSVSPGDAVTFDGSGNATTTAASDDTVLGVAGNIRKGEDADDKYPVNLAGMVLVVKLDDGVTAGDTLVPSGTNAGQFAAHNDGTYYAEADGNDVAADHPIALTDTNADGLGLALYR